MRTPIIACVGSVLVFLVLDGLWLGLVARGFYQDQIGHLLRPRPLLGVAAIFYAVFVAGLVHFAVMPALASGRWTDAAIAGALLGLLAYATYDISNLATLRDWPVAVAVVDIAWGTLLSALAATGGWLAARWI
jgi:uncharacterized membrane protein